jgi:3'(2'), 5'-bisphosphate nucleotidase
MTRGIPNFPDAMDEYPPSTISRLEREVRTAIQVVRGAVALLTGLLVERREVIAKADTSPVTFWDFAIQAFVAARLEASFPDDPLVAEEDCRTLRSAVSASGIAQIANVVGRLIRDASVEQLEHWIDRGSGACTTRFWVLDPIDGTRGFVRGDQFAVALALLVDGRPEVAVLACPRLTLRTLSRFEGCLVLGVREGGAWAASLDGHSWARLRVSDVADPRAARLLRSFEERHTDVGRTARAIGTMGATRAPVLMDSQAKYAVLAAGDADLMIRFPSSPGFHDAIWDLAPGTLILTEAGGWVTDLHGATFDFRTGRRLIHNEGVLASNRHLHEAAIAAIRGT